MGLYDKLLEMKAFYTSKLSKDLNREELLDTLDNLEEIDMYIQMIKNFGKRNMETHY